LNRTRHSKIARTQSQGVGPLGKNQTLVRDVVETVTLRAEAVMALRVTVAETEQIAPAGALERVMVAMPAIPVPPMERA
jgi:hypothetical protein